MSATYRLADAASKIHDQTGPLPIANAVQATPPIWGDRLYRDRGVAVGKCAGVIKKPAPENIRYYNLKRNWTKKIEPHLDDKELNDTLTRDMNKFTTVRLGCPFGEDELPHHTESCLGFFEQRGPFARYRYYTRHGACHWLVNFCLRLATLASPAKEWSIITSDTHSTGWVVKIYYLILIFITWVSQPPSVSNWRVTRN